MHAAAIVENGHFEPEAFSDICTLTDIARITPADSALLFDPLRQLMGNRMPEEQSAETALHIAYIAWHFRNHRPTAQSERGSSFKPATRL